MSTDPFSRFMPAVCAGFGLVLVGGANLLLSRRGRSVRVLASAAALGAASAAAVAIGYGVLVRSAPLLAVGLIPCLFASHRVAERAALLVRRLHRPLTPFGALVVIGLAMGAGGLFLYERAAAAEADADTADLESMLDRPGRVPSGTGRAATDRGTQIVLGEPATGQRGPDRREAEDRLLRSARLSDQVIRCQPSDDRSNCHGWVFTDGRFHLTGEDVALILQENSYEAVSEPQADDLVIYRSGETILHSALVRYVTKGRPVMVEGKWGVFGVFLHPANKCTYGTDYTFYRSSRHGHLLAGVDDSSSQLAAE